MNISQLKRAIELDLSEKFQNPTIEQKNVITAVIGLLSHAEWMDCSDRHDLAGTAVGSFRYDSAPSPRRVRAVRARKLTKTVDECLNDLRRMGWKPWDGSDR